MSSRCVRLAAIVGLLLACAAGRVAAQSLDWVKRDGGVDLDQARGVGVDAAGNTYVTGIFSKSLACFFCGQPVTFGAGTPNETILTSVDGTQDIFVAKYDTRGVLQWARSAGTGGADEAYGIAVDSAGNSYVTGNMFGAFVLKYDTNGNVVWTTSLDIAGVGFAIDVGPDGSTVVGGAAPDPAVGSGTITVWKVGADGNVLWTRHATGLYAAGGGTGVSIDASGNSSVAGLLFAGSATFGAGEPNETTLSDVNGAGNEMFVARYDAAGNLLWARQSPDEPGSSNYAQAVSTDADGNTYVAGVGAALLPGLEPSVHNTYIAKYDTLGNLVWAEGISGNGSPTGINGIANDPGGHIYITGNFATTMTFAPGRANPTTLFSLAGFFGGDLFVAKYDRDANFLWARQAGGGVSGNAIAVDSAGAAYVAGTFSGITEFGPGEPNETVISTTGIFDSDIFAARFANDAPVANRPPVAADQSVTTAEDTPVAIALAATDPDNDPLTYEIVAPPSHGVSSGTPPAIIYTPNPNYYGADSFTFRAFDGVAFSNVATVTVDVTPVNDVPVADSQALVTSEDTPVPVTLTGHDVDGDALTFTVVGGPLHGTLSGTPPALTYTPNPDYVGPDSFTFTAFDGTAVSAPASVAISVVAIALNCGVRASGAIETPGEVDRFSFSGAAGQIISLALATTGGFSGNPFTRFSAEMTLFSPTGALVGTLHSNSQANFTLPADGEYEIRVRATNGTTTGSYNLNRECLFPTQSPDAVPLPCGTLASGGIDAPGDVDLFTLGGQAGEVISLTLATTGGFSGNPFSRFSVEMSLFSPSGALIGALHSNRQATFTLPDTGLYVIRVSATNLGTTGSYNLNRECLFPTPSPDAVPLPDGTLASGAIEAPGDVDLFTLSGQAGEIISFTLSTTGGFSGNAFTSVTVAMTLSSPTGALVGTLHSNSQANFTLPESGLYIIQVNATNLGTTGSYNLKRVRLFPTPSPSAVPLPCGTLASGAIEAPGDVDLFTLTGQAGEIISLALSTTGGFSGNSFTSVTVAMTLFSPTGAPVGTLHSNSQANFTLPESGLYVIRVNATNLGTTGSYNLNRECLFPTPSPDALPLPCGTLASGAIDAAGDVDLFTMSGQAGQVISLALTSTGGFSGNPFTTVTAEMTLFSPTGALVGTLRSNSQASFTLPTGGLYVIRVSATNLGTIGSYTLRVNCN